MSEKRTIERARKDKQKSKGPSTQAGEFAKEEIDPGAHCLAYRGCPGSGNKAWVRILAQDIEGLVFLNLVAPNLVQTFFDAFEAPLRSKNFDKMP